MRTLLYFLLYLLLCQPSYAQPDETLESNETVYVYEHTATIWDPEDLGVTYAQCKIPTPENMEACERRLAWPPGGSELTVQRAAVKIENKDYVYVKSGDNWGWTELNYLNGSRTEFAKPGNLYEKPGYDYARCQKEKINPICKSRLYMKANSKIDKFAPTEVTVKVRSADPNEPNETYVMVEQVSGKKKTRGWVQKSSLSSIKDRSTISSDVNSDSETHAGVCVGCMAGGSKSSFEVIEDATKEIVGASQTYKDARAMERYACIYSSQKNYPGGFSKNKFCQMYQGRSPNFKERIASAAKAFSLPESLIGCTLLVESAMYASPSERDEYRGYGQFGRAAVEDLGRRVKGSPYNKMWANYTGKSSSQFNNTNIRIRNDVDVSVGAVAMYLKWLIREQIPSSGCRNCSGSSSVPSQKDVYMAIAGYNWSPWGLPKLAGKTTQQMRAGPPPPRETRNYFGKMDRCLSANNFSTFSGNSMSAEYRSRGAQCAQPCN